MKKEQKQNKKKTERMSENELDTVSGGRNGDLCNSGYNQLQIQLPRRHPEPYSSPYDLPH